MLCYRLDKAGFDAILQARPELVEALSQVVAARQAANDATLQALSAEARAQAGGRARAPSSCAGSSGFFAIARPERRRGVADRAGDEVLALQQEHAVRRRSPSSSQTNGSRGNASFDGAAVVADLDDERAAGIEEARRLARGSSRTASRPSSPPASARRGSCRYSARQVVHRHRRHVRRIADDEVVALLGQVREQIGADEVDAVGEPVVGDVALRDRERVGRDVDGVDVGVGIGVREQDREAARAGAQVERASATSSAVADVGREAVGQQLGDERARNDARARRRRSGSRRATLRA